jgi:protoporphyrinogen oxidase
METKWIIAGGGISGLAAAKILQSNNCKYLLLERSQSLGGLTRTTQVDDFCFDYTGHFLHLSRYKSPSQIPYANLDDDDWQTIDRKSYFYAADRLITTPIQYHLGQLPADIRSECVESYDARPKQDHSVDSFREFIVSGFGQVVAERFLIPQNEKTMATTLGRLSIDAVKRFFPPPDELRIRAGLTEQDVQGSEYNARFWYPKKGGIDLLVRGFADRLDNAVTGEEIARVDLPRRRVVTTSGRSFSWEYMLPSIPLKRFCEIADDKHLRAAARQLSHSSTISFNFGLRGNLPKELRDAHWIYVPDPAIPFYRFGCYSNISAGTCSSGQSSVYVEVGVPGDQVDGIDISGDLQSRVVSALEGLRWMRREDIVCSVVQVIRCAYVHHTPEREAVVRDIRSRLNHFGIYPIGRYGLWDYIGMEDSIESAFSTVRKLMQ